MSFPDKHRGRCGIGVGIAYVAHALGHRMMVDGKRCASRIQQAARFLPDALAGGDVHADEDIDRPSNAPEKTSSSLPGSTRARFASIGSSLTSTHATCLPHRRRAWASASCEDRQSPSGLTWPQMTKLSSMANRDAIWRSVQFVCGVTVMRSPIPHRGHRRRLRPPQLHKRPRSRPIAGFSRRRARAPWRCAAPRRPSDRG